MDESDIQRELRAGQYSAAFALLLERCKERVFRLAWSILRNETQAEDAAQDVFVKIWKGLPAYQGGASLSTWIFAITRNTCLSELTRRGRHPTVSLQEPAMEAASDSIPALRSADPEPGAEMDVKILLAQLPEKYRQVITLFYLEQKAYEEVAGMLASPWGRSRHLFSARKKNCCESMRERRERSRLRHHRGAQRSARPIGRKQTQSQARRRRISSACPKARLHQGSSYCDLCRARKLKTEFWITRKTSCPPRNGRKWKRTLAVASTAGH